jgi:hypothetical protein
MPPGIVPQLGEKVDLGRAVLGTNQGPDHATQGIASVEDGQVSPTGDSCPLPDQLHSQCAIGPERLLRSSATTAHQQLTLTEIEPSIDRQKPGGLIGVVQQCPADNPVVCPDGGGPVRASGGVLMEGASAPDVLPGAVIDFGPAE